MRETLATILWEGWTALVLCAAAVFLPGSEALTYPAVLWPGLVLAAAVPTGWAFWALAEQPAPLPPEQLLEQALERTRHLQPELLGLPLPCSVEETTFYEQQPQLLRRTEAQALALARLHSLQALYTAFPDAVLIARKEDTSCTDTTLEYTAVYTLEADICTQNDPGS